MQIEQQGSQKPNFGLVGLLAAAALLVIIIASVVLVTWRSHKVNKAPYSKHPVSMLRERPAPVLLD